MNGADKLSIVISTFGSDSWRELALQRAYPSAQSQAVDEIILHHDAEASLAQTRNDAIRRAKGDLIIVLDGDDELEPGYVDAMRKCPGDIRCPRVRYIDDSVVDPAFWPTPQIIPRRDLFTGNFLVIGSAFRRAQFLRVGGFEEYRAYEDWQLWLKMWIDGAQIFLCRDAVYRAHVSRSGRNLVEDPLEIFYKILQDIKPRAMARGLMR